MVTCISLTDERYAIKIVQSIYCEILDNNIFHVFPNCRVYNLLNNKILRGICTCIFLCTTQCAYLLSVRLSILGDLDNTSYMMVDYGAVYRGYSLLAWFHSFMQITEDCFGTISTSESWRQVWCQHQLFFAVSLV